MINFVQLGCQCIDLQNPPNIRWHAVEMEFDREKIEDDTSKNVTFCTDETFLPATLLRGALCHLKKSLKNFASFDKITRVSVKIF